MVKDCEVCIRTKVSWYKLYREFQILSVFKWIWSSVIIDFIVKLSKFKDPVSNISYNSILVIIKHFTKYSKFIFANKSHLTKDLIDIIIRKVINNYRLLNEFIIDKGTIFALQFFITFITKLGINNKLSTTFHPQTINK